MHTIRVFSGSIQFQEFIWDAGLSIKVHLIPLSGHITILGSKGISCILSFLAHSFIRMSRASIEHGPYWVEVHKSECHSGQTCHPGQWFSNFALKTSTWCKEVSFGVTMVVKDDGYGRLQTPTSASPLHLEQLHFYSGLPHTFIQRASWPQSLWKTNDLRISCSQNACRCYLDVPRGLFLSLNVVLWDAIR